MNYIKLLIFVFIFCSCKEIKNNKENTETSSSNYSIVEEIKFQENILGYFFCNSKLKDSIRWEEPDTPQIGFTITGNKIDGIYVRSYNGYLPDSLDFSRVNNLRLKNSILKSNKEILPNEKITFIEVYDSFFYDSIINLRMFSNLMNIDIKNSKTNFVINDTLPLEQLRYIEMDSLYPSREINIDFNKLPNLKALSFKCKNCKIDIPHDSLNLIYKEDENGIEITKGSYPIISWLDNKK